MVYSLPVVKCSSFSDDYEKKKKNVAALDAQVVGEHRVYGLSIPWCKVAYGLFIAKSVLYEGA